MSVPIVEGMTELEGFTTYIQYNSQTQTIEYLDQIETLPDIQTAETLGDGVIDYHGPLSFKIEGWQPELEGGTVVGAGAVDVAATATGYEVTTGAATVGAVSLIELLGGILAGLGVGILSYEANKDFWIDISNNLFLNVPGYVPITYENIEDMSIMTLFKNNKTYVSYDLVQAVNNYLIEQGWLEEETIITIDVPTEAGDYSFDSIDVTTANMHHTFSKLLEEFGTHGGGAEASRAIMLHKAFIKALEGLSASVYQSATNYYIIIQDASSDGTSWGIFSVRIYLFNDTLPLQRTLSSGDIKKGYANIPNSRSTSIYAVSGMVQGSISGTNYEATDVLANDTFGKSVGYVISDRGLSSFNNNVEIIPAVPELVPLQPRTISTTPNSIPQELSTWWALREHIAQVKTDPQTGTKTLTQKDLLPITVPNTSVKTTNVTTPQTQVQTGTTPETNTDPVTKTAVNPFTAPDSPIKVPTQVPTPTPTPTPSIPVIPAIGGQANALFTVYNPSQANLNSLGSVLWTENIIQQIVQMFTNNPMDAIISLHILYATPQTGANKEIKLGYLPTGVSCPEVTNQYVNLNCGTVRVPELFGDVRDYANTDITIYLPMIGFRQLKTEDAMASYITVDYKVDVYTGTVLANVIIRRDSTNQVFYTFEGNCAVNLPLTGADKSRQLATAVGVIGATVMGSPLMGLASMAGVAGGGAKANLTRSGNFTGNAGAMGCKKPYLIVSSDVPYDAAGYNTQYGYPANLTVMLGTCHGYVKAKEVHADSIANATEKEKREIENQLKQGVIIH